MKTRFSKLIKPTLLVGAVMSFISVNAGIVVPSPVVYMGHGHGHISANQAIGLLIVINIVCMLIVIIRSLVWLVKRPRWTYVEYVWFDSNAVLLTPFLTTCTLVVVNGFGGIMFLANWISTLL